jgi:3-isopropylmalate/(R)-2-methylmalate dehydratase large subunit
MCNMAIEAGAKCGVVGYDETTAAYLQGRPAGSRARDGGVEASDPDAEFVREIEIDAAAVSPPCRCRTCRPTRRRRRASPASPSTRS